MQGRIKNVNDIQVGQVNDKIESKVQESDAKEHDKNVT